MAILGKQLDQGDNFPDLTWKLLDGSRISIPGDLEERWNVIIILRGHW